MATTYAWTISSLDVAPSEDTLTDVIKTAHWRLRGSDDTDGLATDIYGAQAFAAPDPAAYTPYAEVSSAALIGWLEGAMGSDEVDAMHARLDAAIAMMRTPEIVSGPPPWVAAGALDA